MFLEIIIVTIEEIKAEVLKREIKVAAVFFHDNNPDDNLSVVSVAPVPGLPLSSL